LAWDADPLHDKGVRAMAWLTVMSMVKVVLSVVYVAMALGFAGVLAWVTPLGSVPLRTVPGGWQASGEPTDPVDEPARIAEPIVLLRVA
jgi:hypothetical protein